MKRLIFSLLLTLQACLANPQVKETKANTIFYNDIKEFVKTNYMDEVKDDKFIFDSLNGGLSGLDPHSAYISPDDYTPFKESIEGEFGGIGVQIISDSNFVKVIAVLENSPAAKAGVKPGDYITHVNGESTYKILLDKASSLMRGKEGTGITIVVLRENSGPIEFAIKREKIKNDSINIKMFEDILLLKISNFTSSTGKDIENALIENKTAKGIVIDLRNNPGGFLNQSVAIANFLLPQGKDIVKFKSRMKVDIRKEGSLYCDKYKKCETIDFRVEEEAFTFVSTSKELVSSSTPIVVLINKGSASASEILAGALKDHKRAIVVGELSFGKGLIQTIIPIEDGKMGALKLSTSKYYTPRGEPVQTIGISPDIVIPSGKINLEGEKFRDLFSYREQDLKNHTLAENLEKAAKSSKEYKDSESAVKIYYNDLQLLTAVSIIKALSIK